MQNKRNHTPGPWGYEHVQGSEWQVHARGESEAYKGVDVALAIVQSWDGEPPRERIEANARLIAASPELLDTLILALPYVESAEHDNGYKPGAVAKMVSRMRAAIASAEA